MNRRVLLRLACAACGLLFIGAMSWLTVTALRVDRAERDARVFADTEEAVRLALWRMELALAPLITQESAWPYFFYSSFYPAERAYGRMFGELRAGELLMPSPLLASPSAYVLLHFQVDPDGTMRSPEVPVEAMRELAVRLELLDADTVSSRDALLGTLRERLAPFDIAALPAPELARPETPRPVVMVARDREQVSQPAAPQPEPGSQQEAVQDVQLFEPPANDVQGVSIAPELAQELQRQVQEGQRLAPPQPPPAQGAQRQADAQIAQAPAMQRELQTQQRKGAVEYNWRNLAKDSALNTANNEFVQGWSYGLLSNKKGAVRAPEVLQGAMTARWSGTHLLLARRVSVAGKDYAQGCVLDWLAIERWLLATVRDLLPEARLEPCPDAPTRTPERMLAGLPARLIPGAIAHEPAPFFSPIRVALVVVWPCMLLAAGALLGLLVGAIRLSERRGAFVSSVTHELRTPLTTFRMYAEMLAEGMVPTETQRNEYLRTLCTQADRLSHLVENVLTYARIERKRLQFTQESLPIDELLRRTRDRLEERARHAGMQLVVEVAPEPAAAAVRTCPSAVEQILFNLVDNACKYASSAKDTRIHLRVESDDGGVRVLVADHGPGVAPEQLRTLFTPFSKSARDAANSAPGVGLGLALSKRLARAIGADLFHVATPEYGACFALRLRR